MPRTSKRLLLFRFCDLNFEVFLISSTCTVCPADLIIHDFIIRILLHIILPGNLDSKGFSRCLFLLLLLLLLLHITSILTTVLGTAGERNKLGNIHTADQFLSFISLLRNDLENNKTCRKMALKAKRVFHPFLQRFLEISFRPVNILRVTLEFRAETQQFIHVESLIGSSFKHS
jgi:hypothetical protein